MARGDDSVLLINFSFPVLRKLFLKTMSQPIPLRLRQLHRPMGINMHKPEGTEQSADNEVRRFGGVWSLRAATGESAHGIETPDIDIGFCGWFLVLCSIFLTILTLPISIWMCIKVLTKDSVTVSVDGVVYYRVQNATLAVANITNADAATRLLAQTTLRNVLGTKNLAEILSDREEIAHSMQLQRAMAAEAEATREARAKVIAAEGEMNASRALKEASLVIAESPSALQLRYLQTLNTIAAEKNSTIIFPLPIDMMQSFLKR
ncbi:Erythrocyte band 7 integral membrane protein [Bagarius yarrelli]|uniref:Podocin n=1 Tax=Bagarius yarrelli TaxID=175774 RepID=A0A556TUH2_BAGYA|nr:Erythrocyte band 7 integral membrane protein [Bagarius yarrelli]